MIERLQGKFTRGVVVVDLVRKGPAERAGFLPGDILLSLGSSPLETIDTLQQFLEDHPPQQAYPVDFIRSGELRTVWVRPDTA
jgi:S1-C subfamily serine protease